jgi:uncharacterized protein with von Willebrand factor type A (vWA) domain
VHAPLLAFVRAAREAGVRISPAETMDALKAADVVGYGDRAALKDALSLALAKSAEEKERLSDCFDVFFSRQEPAATAPDEPEQPESQTADGAEPPPEPSELGALAEALMNGDRAALAQAIEAAAAATGLANIRVFTQAGLFTRRMLEQMGLERLDADIEAMEARRPGGGETLRQAANALRGQVRQRVEQDLTLYARAAGERLREDVLSNVRMSQIDRRDLDRMRKLVRDMARRLRDRHARRRKRRDRGQLDTRRTIKRNAGWGGVPFVTVWKQKKLDRPRLVVLCDVSGSVAAVSEFLLTFLYALSDVLNDIRSFAFAGEMVEVSEILDQKPVDEAVTEILRKVGYGSSDYGQSLVDFEEGWMQAVTNRTTVLILGDARGNYSDPRTDVLRRISERAKRVIWLNPEYRVTWGTGDSEMPRYAPYCHVVAECGTLNQLGRVVSDLMKAVS